MKTYTLLVSIFTISTLTATPEKPTLFDSLKNTYDQNKVVIHIGAGVLSLYVAKKAVTPAVGFAAVLTALASTESAAAAWAMASVVVPIAGTVVAAPAGFGVWNFYKATQEVLKK